MDSILGVITRHPMRQEELKSTLLNWSPDQLAEALSALEASGRAQVVERYRVRFWSALGAYFPNKKS
ncbi:MAG: hypothetical protein MUO62_10550 [Anaerolineales bacterium]|nr:hypothetical protein [Anaerolineales bacterium]